MKQQRMSLPWWCCGQNWWKFVMRRRSARGLVLPCFGSRSGQVFTLGRLSLFKSAQRVRVYCTRASVCVGVHMWMCGGVWRHGNRHMVTITMGKSVQKRWKEETWNRAGDIWVTVRQRWGRFYFLWSRHDTATQQDHVHPPQVQLYISCKCHMTFSHHVRWRAPPPFQTLRLDSGPQRVCHCSVRRLGDQIVINRDQQTLRFFSHLDKKWNVQTINGPKKKMTKLHSFQLFNEYLRVLDCYKPLEGVGLWEHFDTWNTVSKKTSWNIYSKTFLFARQWKNCCLLQSGNMELVYHLDLNCHHEQIWSYSHIIRI